MENGLKHNTFLLKYIYVDTVLTIYFYFPLYSVNEEFELVMGKHVEIVLNTTVNNFGESAYESRMFVVHPDSVNYIGIVKINDVIRLFSHYFCI